MIRLNRQGAMQIEHIFGGVQCPGGAGIASPTIIPELPAPIEA